MTHAHTCISKTELYQYYNIARTQVFLDIAWRISGHESIVWPGLWSICSGDQHIPFGPQSWVVNCSIWKLKEMPDTNFGQKITISFFVQVQISTPFKRISKYPKVLKRQYVQISPLFNFRAFWTYVPSHLLAHVDIGFLL